MFALCAGMGENRHTEVSGGKGGGGGGVGRWLHHSMTHLLVVDDAGDASLPGCVVVLWALDLSRGFCLFLRFLVFQTRTVTNLQFSRITRLSKPLFLLGNEKCDFTIHKSFASKEWAVLARAQTKKYSTKNLFKCLDF